MSELDESIFSPSSPHAPTRTPPSDLPPTSSLYVLTRFFFTSSRLMLDRNEQVRHPIVAGQQLPGTYPVLAT